MDHIQKHFDILAPEYDTWKKRNRYYYDAVKKVYGNLIPSGARVLEIGCGTGEILASLKPVFGVGIDVSGEMIKRAQQKYAQQKNLVFYHVDVATLAPSLQNGMTSGVFSERTMLHFDRESKFGDLDVAQKYGNATPFFSAGFDYIFLADVIEHLSNVSGAIRSVARLMHPETTLIVSMANPLWEPLLMLAEKLHMKMPEGPHTRISAKELISFCNEAGLRLVQRDYALLFPKYIPIFSNLVNRVGGSIPLFRRFGVITVFVFTPHIT